MTAIRKFRDTSHAIGEGDQRFEALRPLYIVIVDYQPDHLVNLSVLIEAIAP